MGEENGDENKQNILNYQISTSTMKFTAIVVIIAILFTHANAIRPQKITKV
jgi:hypothetical protein